jgi:hypothetical protein
VEPTGIEPSPDLGAAIGWGSLLDQGLATQEFIAIIGASAEFQAIYNFSHA